MLEIENQNPELLELNVRFSVAREIIERTVADSIRLMGRLSADQSVDLLPIQDALADALAGIDDAGMVFHTAIMNKDYELEEVDSVADADDSLPDPDLEVSDEPPENESLTDDVAVDEEPEVTDSEQFLENVLDYLRTVKARERIADGELLKINIGQIAREMNNGDNLPPDEFHKLVQWLNKQFFVVEQTGSTYTINVPEVSVSGELGLPSDLCDQVYSLIMGSTDLGAQLHVNQICNLLGINGLTKEQKREVIMSLADDERFAKKSGTTIMLAPVDFSKRSAKPDQKTGQEVDVLSFLETQELRELAEACMAERGILTLNLARDIPFLAVKSDTELKKFKTSGIQGYKDLIKEQLEAAGFGIEWTTDGKKKGFRHILIIDRSKVSATQTTSEQEASSNSSPAPVKPATNQPPTKKIANTTRTRRNIELKRDQTPKNHSHTNGDVQILGVSEQRDLERSIIFHLSKADSVKGSLALKAIETSSRQDQPVIRATIAQMITDGKISKTNSQGSVYYKLLV